MLRVEDAHVGQHVTVIGPYPGDPFVGMAGTIIRIYPERAQGRHPYDVEVPEASDWFVFAPHEIEQHPQISPSADRPTSPPAEINSGINGIIS